MITFDINGSIVEFDVYMDNYNKIRKQFDIYAKDSISIFNDNLIDNIINLNDLHKKSLELGNELIDSILKKGIKTLIEYKLITVDIDIFKNIYFKKYFDFERILNNKIKQASPKGKKNNYLTYEAINSLIEDISEILYNNCFNIHNAVIDALIDNNIEDISYTLTDENIKVSNALFNNYKDGFINKSLNYDVVNKIITLNPYRLDVYKYLIKEDGDFNRQIESLINYLGYEISDYKKELMNNYIDTLENSDDLEIDKEKVKKYSRYIGCENEHIYLARIEGMYAFKNA